MPEYGETDLSMNNNGHSPGSKPAAETRWRPSRSGLLNFYRYDNQEFHFHQGRLLLRGNNGTGKSRVLALQLPFLLDGEISPDRVEPDGDRAKRFEWNLLMGKYEDRLGYTWIEFERIGADGVLQYLTLGCGVRATTGRSGVGRWFFITPQRMGHDFSLCSSQDNPLPKDALAEALGSNAQLFTTASAYREEVNRRLFGLPQTRYEAMIKLLIELRQPKLSRNLDEKTLSAALSDSLPPVSSGIIQQVSDAIRAMDQDRHALADLESAKKSADAFLLEYRRYAQIIAARRSEEVRKTHSACEKRQRALREAETEHAAAVNETQRLRLLEEKLSLDLAAAKGRKATLDSSPQMRTARELNHARKEADDRASESNRLSEEYARAVEAMTDAETEYERETDQVKIIAERLTLRVNESDRYAVACESDKPHRSATERAAVLQPQDRSLIDDAESSLNKTIEARRAGSRLLRGLNDEIGVSTRAWQQTLDRRDEQKGRLAESISVLQTSQDAVSQALKDLSVAYRDWCGSLALLTSATPVDIVPVIASWSDGSIGTAGPVRLAVEQAVNQFRRRIAVERAAKSAELGEQRESLQGMTDERDRLLSGQHQRPPSPYTRDERSRLDRAGAPFWKLCEFAEAVPDDHRAAIEAALESAGVLDAWIDPNGNVIATGAFDTFLIGDGKAVAGAALIDVLRPSSTAAVAGTSPVPEDVVENILRRIGLGEGAASAWVDVTGRWQIGVLSGQWSKPAAQHIGQSAREAERIRRIRELEVRIVESQKSIETLLAAINEIDRRSQLADAEAARAPSEDGVRIAIAKRDAQRTQCDQAEHRLAESEAVLVRAKGALQRKIDHRNTSAADLRLSNWVDRVQALDDALADYRQALLALWSTAREYMVAARSVGASKSRLDRERERSERLKGASLDASQKAATAQSHYQTLQQTVGAVVEEVQRQLGAAEALLDQLTAEQTKNAREIGGANERVASLEKSIRDLGMEISEEIARRAAAIERLLRFTRTALIDITDDSLAGVGRGEMAVTPAVELARQIGATLAYVPSDENAWTATQRAIYSHIQNLTTSLQSHDYRPDTVTEDDIQVVTAPFRGAQLPMRQFSTMLAEEIVNRRSLLSAKELELLENYLIQDVAVEMGRLIREAETLVASMNKQLSSRRTSTGMQLRFHWEPDTEGPAAFADARKKLLGDNATWSPADRTALGQFLQEQINRAREADAASTWQEQLSAALDYRRWHQFHVERRQDNKWVRLTRKTHGTGSGGEKAVALTIPQFAAASAYYDSASGHAPRLILLDEVFAGIDRDMRGKCMGLLHEFDLDFVMTSENEWGCYRSLPGLAIYQLSAREGIDAVWASRWVWNGRERVQQNPDLTNRIAVASENNGLFRSDRTEASS
jgi:uncharacterized protein (TIGR02680 family)